jgi:hypothetical protein
MTKMSEISIGIDISKDHLDVHILPDGVATQFPNTTLGFRALARHLAGHHVARLVYEPTGPYHAGFERAMASRNWLSARAWRCIYSRRASAPNNSPNNNPTAAPISIISRCCQLIGRVRNPMRLDNMSETKKKAPANCTRITAAIKYVSFNWSPPLFLQLTAAQ